LQRETREKGDEGLVSGPLPVENVLRGGAYREVRAKAPYSDQKGGKGETSHEEIRETSEAPLKFKRPKKKTSSKEGEKGEERLWGKKNS